LKVIHGANGENKLSASSRKGAIMNCKTHKIETLAMLLASGSPGSAGAWSRHVEAEQANRPAAREDAVSEMVDKLYKQGKEFNFLP
jgi:hypothetical protein